MKVGIFGSEYQIERQNLIKRLFEKLREQEADIYVDSPFYTFLTDAFGFEPVVSGLLVGDEFDLDIALSVGVTSIDLQKRTLYSSPFSFMSLTSSFHSFITFGSE